ncbi:MAG TPA: ABC transporter ATP-binding protein [Solirubrobacteraceae bacterium]|jgi:putative ABC transport system ATP-binding protein|nr:ABC transporter ATP-binding protein [Solirubrobacteraceae bacterium]
MSPLESALSLQEVVKHYPSGGETVRAVDGVSLEIEAGEFVALYGPSGSGKTTLLRLAAGLMTPDSGKVQFDGRDVAGMSSRESASYRLRDVGFVFQSFHLMPATSALDNALIKLPILGYTVREAREKTTPWLCRVGLADRLDHRPEQLSMGERQRVAIARALVGNPRLVLADEPTGNLDSKRTHEILSLLGEVSHECRIPTLLVTHDAEALAFVDRTLTLRDGRLLDGMDAELAQLSS